MNSLIEYGRRVAGDILPENKFKEHLRGLLFRHYHPLDFITGILSKGELQKDGTMLLELKDGTVFYVNQDQESDESTHQWQRPYSGCGNYNALTMIEKSEWFGTLWIQMIEQYRDDIYQKHYKIKKGDTIIDVGAHIGLFAVRAAAAVGAEGKVVAIEPEPDNLRLLRRNIQANRLQNVVTVPKGVWSRKDRLKLFIRAGTGQHSLLDPRDPNRFTEVEVDTLDNISKELGIKKIDFIKMDIEGAEIEAYKGIQETLKDNDLKLAIAAYHPMEGRQETYGTIARWLKNDGFEVRVKKGFVYARKQSHA